MNVGGTAHYVEKLILNIPESELATGYVQGEEIEDSIVKNLKTNRIRHLGRKISPINDFKAWCELRKLIKILKPQIVHTHTFKAGLIGRLIRGNHVRVHTYHGHLFGDQTFSNFQKKIIVMAEKFLAHRTDVLISVGEKVGDELLAKGIGVKSTWRSIPPGVDPLVKIDKYKAREMLGVQHQDFIVGWMARMTGVKNPRLALEVARRLPSVKFLMAGGGDLLDAIMAEAPSNVHVLGWTNASTFWSAVDCALSTSDNEGMPVALIEARLAGLPVIATNVGSNSEIIINGITGLITSKNVDELANAVRRVVQNPKMIASWDKHFASSYAESISINAMVAKHLKVYNQFLLNDNLNSKL